MRVLQGQCGVRRAPLGNRIFCHELLTQFDRNAANAVIPATKFAANPLATLVLFATTGSRKFSKAACTFALQSRVACTGMW